MTTSFHEPRFFLRLPNRDLITIYLTTCIFSSNIQPCFHHNIQHNVDSDWSRIYHLSCQLSETSSFPGKWRHSQDEFPGFNSLKAFGLEETKSAL